MRERILSTFVVLAAIYEWIAVHWHPWPTLTALIRPHRDIDVLVVVGCVTVLSISVLLLLHLFAGRST